MTWSSDGNLLVASSTDGFCSIVRFSEGELGVIAEEETFKLSLLNKSSNNIQVTETTDVHNKENIDLVLSKVMDVNTVTPNKRKEKQNTPTNTPKQKSLSAKKKMNTPSVSDNDMVKNAVLIDEAAMEPWSQDAVSSFDKDHSVENTDVVASNEIVIDDPTEDFKMVYEETENDVREKANNTLEKKQDEKNCNKTNSEENNSSEKDKPDHEKQLNVPEMPIEKSHSILEKDVPPKILPKTPRRVNFITLSSPKNKKQL